MSVRPLASERPYWEYNFFGKVTFPSPFWLFFIIIRISFSIACLYYNSILCSIQAAARRTEPGRSLGFCCGFAPCSPLLPSPPPRCSLLPLPASRRPSPWRPPSPACSPAPSPPASRSRFPSSVAPSSSVPRLLARPLPARVARAGLLMRGRLVY